MSFDADARSPHVALYDGVCGLCNRFVQFLLAHDRRGRLRFASLQSQRAVATLVQHGKPTDSPQTMWVIRDAGTQRESLLARSRAVLFALNQVGLPWSVLGLASVIPRQVLDVAYDLVARNRFRIFGQTERCMLAPPAGETRSTS